MGLDIAGNIRYPAPRPDWLALVEEDVLEPDLPIIDAHHHIWEEPGNPYLLGHLVADLASGHNVVATVLVEAHYGYRDHGPLALRPVGETEKIVSLIAEAKERKLEAHMCAAIVSHADLTLGNAVEAVLADHVAVAGARIKGIRHSVSRDPHYPDGIVVRAAPEGLLADGRYREGLAVLARNGLSYDAMLYHNQIPELAAAARALPDLQIMLDHYGCIIGIGPYVGREAESFRAWRASMADLATCPNVSVKLGGMGMIVTGANWHERDRPPSSAELAEAWRPYTETCIDLFGADRCCFESNFPVDKAMYSYRTLWNAFKLLAAGASASEKAALFQGTASRFYRIGVNG
jgi:L-fuconolactonase